MEIGSKIRELRLKADLTQEELGDRCELTKGYISQLENDVTSFGSPSCQKGTVAQFFFCAVTKQGRLTGHQLAAALIYRHISVIGPDKTAFFFLQLRRSGN